MRDPYQVLGIKKAASEAEIKKAYRAIAKKTHPDMHPDDPIVEQRFKQATSAYDLLSDKEKRGQFDRGEIDADGKPLSNFGFDTAHTANGFGFRGSGVEDIFSDLFGGMHGGRRASMGQIPGTDVRYSVEVDFISAIKGVRRTITKHDGKKINVNVPSGTEHGQSLRLKGQGLSGKRGGATGDAFVEVRVKPHQFFKRDKGDIEIEIPISIDEAILGAKITVPTIDGQVTVSLPPHTSSGTRLRLKGKGVPASRKSGSPGDQYVKLNIALPTNIDNDLKIFFEEWSKKHPSDIRRKFWIE